MNMTACGNPRRDPARAQRRSPRRSCDGRARAARHRELRATWLYTHAAEAENGVQRSASKRYVATIDSRYSEDDESSL
jgi:hypothetical protein